MAATIANTKARAHGFAAFAAGDASGSVASGRSAGGAGRSAGPPSSGRNAKYGRRCRSSTAVTATTKEIEVATSVGIQIARGICDPAAKRIAAVPVGGISTIDAELIARNSAIALVATPGWGLRRSSSTMALMPNGVAALPSPSMLDERFITIAPIAGWSGGTSGKKRRRIGCSTRTITRSRPASAAMRTKPRNKIIAPTRPIRSSTADFAPSSAPAETRFMHVRGAEMPCSASCSAESVSQGNPPRASFTAATETAPRIKAAQIQFNMR